MVSFFCSGFAFTILTTIASCSCAGNNNWDKQNHFCIHTIRSQTTTRKGIVFLKKTNKQNNFYLLNFRFFHFDLTISDHIFFKWNPFQSSRIWLICIKLKTNFLLFCFPVSPNCEEESDIVSRNVALPIFSENWQKGNFGNRNSSCKTRLTNVFRIYQIDTDVGKPHWKSQFIWVLPNK